MGYRLRKSVNLGDSVKLNVSKSGLSVSAGKKGLSANLSKRGLKNTIGIPGSGINYSSSESFKDNSDGESQSELDIFDDDPTVSKKANQYYQTIMAAVFLIIFLGFVYVMYWALTIK